MPFTPRDRAPSIISNLVPSPYRLVVESEPQTDLGYFADFYRDDVLIQKFELYPYIVVGPGPHRPADERRVQLELGRRADDLVRDPPRERIGVMLGLRDYDIDGKTPAPTLVLAFSFGIYREMTSRSSLQFPKRVLLEAEVLGASAFVKTSTRMGPPLRAITLAMRPDVLPLFFTELAGHFTQTGSWDSASVEQVQETARRYYNVDRDIRSEAISPAGDGAAKLDAAAEREIRRVVARAVMQPVRSWRFAQSVQRAYGYRCTACDVQLELVEAAHIDPVENLDSSDDVSNGLALCALHHKAYDQGLLEIHADGAITIVSSKLEDLSASLRDGGIDAFRKALRPRIRLPEDSKHWPRSEHFERRAKFRRSNA